ncbi:MAG: SGNH/GDSL hydrolase family protein [Actinomycetota bacterium]|nr:SGNH/GDSL hydrolase family protein [Actinomycetota bacterium]
MRASPCAPVAIAALLAASVLTMSCGSEDNGDGDPDPAGDHLVVSLGDSVASGEGNPDGRDPVRWQNRRCHRSLRSGQALAAAEVLAAEAAGRFVSFACSGAQIDVGVLAAYKGIEPRGDELLKPQVENLASVAEGRTLDAVMLSVGANDVGFSKVVLFCQLVEPCEQKRFDPELPLRRQREARERMSVSVPASIERLAGAYRELDAALPEQIPRERILLVEYFDATSGVGGRPCRFGAISGGEFEWARTHLLAPLNQQLRESSEELGWTLVEGVDEGFAGRGVCARREDRWVASLDDSLFHAGSGFTGTLHPNPRGHAAIAERIVPVLQPLVESGE